MNRLKLLREQKGMKQSELGTLLNVKDAAISKYESGKVLLTSDTLIRLSEIFGVSIDYILGNSSIPTLNSPTNTLNNSITLSEDEQKLISTYRQLTSDEKQVVLGKAIDLKLTSTKERADKKKDIG